MLVSSADGHFYIISRKARRERGGERGEREREREGGELGVFNYTSLFNVLVLLQSLNC